MKARDEIEAKILTFLLIEDDDSHAKIISKSFEKERIFNKIDRVNDGVEGLKYLKQEAEYSNKPIPDIILLDLKLPKLDGFEV